jgi:hypothetical protein
MAVKVGGGAFCVSPAITVCAANVLMAPASGAEKTGSLVQAKLAINNAATGQKFRWE